MPPAQPHKPAHARGGRRHESPHRRRGTRLLAVIVLIVLIGGGVALGLWLHTRPRHGAVRIPRTTTTTPVSTLPPTTTEPTVAGAVAPCTPVTVAGGVYAVGDSVMLDAQQPLQGCVPDIQVNAAVSRQWSDGETLLSQVMAGPSPPSVVVVALGTNGPVTEADFDAMMSILHGASRVVFVTVHVDRPWQDQVNSVLVNGVARYPNAVLADWQGLAAEHPEWFYTDGTHLPIDGVGAQALAGLIASKV